MFSPPHKQTASDHKLKGRNKSPHGNRDPASNSLARCLDKKQIFLSVAIQDTFNFVNIYFVNVDTDGSHDGKSLDCCSNKSLLMEKSIVCSMRESHENYHYLLITLPV